MSICPKKVYNPNATVIKAAFCANFSANEQQILSGKEAAFFVVS
jgi:hypothetical protein